MVKVQKNTVLIVLLLLLCPNCVYMDRLSLIKSPIAAELEEFKRLFDSSLTSSNPLLDSVISHIRQRNGKMMRPILVLLVARLAGPIRPAALYAAVSLELLHTASLIHDDVVDESAERRGQLSVNAIYNNKVSVLSGDYLLATSLVHARKTKSLDIIQVVSALGQDLADGELLQLSNVSNHDFSEEVYFDVIRKKTAALFAACTYSAALSTDMREEEAKAVRLLGEYIGVCFQIKDDIFDYFESEKIGKPTGNDMMEGKLTLPILYALNAYNDAQAEAVAIKVKDGVATTDEIGYLIEYAKEKGGIEYASQVMGDYKQKSLDLLAALPASEIRSSLEAYLHYVTDREK